MSESEAVLCEYWQTDNISENRIEQWCRYAAGYAADSDGTDGGQIYKMLCGIFEL